MQAHGLLRNCERSKYENNNLINIVETYFSLARALSETEYLTLLRNAVYSQSKALELRNTLEVVGFNWYNLKEQIKMIRLSKVPKVASKMLQKNILKQRQSTTQSSPDILSMINEKNMGRAESSYNASMG